MNANEPSLFDIPDLEPPALPDRPQPGRNRETWARTVSAEVTIIDAGALRDAAARAEQNAVTIGLQADPTANDPDVEAAKDPFDVLVWPSTPSAPDKGRRSVGEGVRRVGVDRRSGRPPSCARRVATSAGNVHWEA